MHVPAMTWTTRGAALGAAFKPQDRFRGNTVYALMILTRWSVTLLVAANTALGSIIGHAMVERQLYFAGVTHLATASSLEVAAAAGLCQRRRS